MKITVQIPRFELVSRVDSSKIVDLAGQPIVGFASDGLAVRALPADAEKAQVQQMASLEVEAEISDDDLKGFILKAVADDLRANGETRKAVLSLPASQPL